jgi:hypothetical protein
MAWRNVTKISLFPLHEVYTYILFNSSVIGNTALAGKCSVWFVSLRDSIIAECV